jgi:hypothetical protein
MAYLNKKTRGIDRLIMGCDTIDPSDLICVRCLKYIVFNIR